MSNPIEYIPKPIQPPTQNIPKPQYELKSTLVGKILPPIYLNCKDIRVKVPHLPKSNCKKCMGKGHMGVDSKQKKIFMCPKCYPDCSLTRIE